MLASSNTLHETEPKGLPGRHQRLRIDTIAAVACSSCCGRGRWEWESGCHRRRERWVLKGHKHRLVRIPANREAVRMLASSVHCSENPACPTKFRIKAICMWAVYLIREPNLERDHGWTGHVPHQRRLCVSRRHGCRWERHVRNVANVRRHRGLLAAHAECMCVAPSTSKRVHSPAKDTTSRVLSMEPSPGIRPRKPAHASTRRRAASKKRSLRAWKKRDPTASHGCTT